MFTNRAMRISDWFAAPRHPGNDVATAPSAAPSLLTWSCGTRVHGACPPGHPGLEGWGRLAWH